jgi:ATP/maltotriose-dependent transcriptional regulator MalT
VSRTTAARGPTLAKLTRPKLFDALERPRLHALLDEAVQRPIVWISGPPGAGKSTLVAGYVEASKRPCLWYQIDAADADPGTFQHYMRLAATQLAGKRASALPPYASEPGQDLPRFLRGFCRDLFTVLPPRSIVVLDSIHDAKAGPEHRAAFAQGLEEIPDGINVVVTSRSHPADEFARLIAGRRIARIDAGALRFTSEEAQAMLSGRELARADLERIQRQTDGWGAALVLLREHMSRPGAELEESLGEGRDAVFQYFAGEIFNSAKPDNQRILMLTALPPSITQDDAVELTGNEDASRLLDYLYRRHLFIDRRRGTCTTYHYHALFREFLLEEGKRRLPRQERRAASARAAALLRASGHAAEALALYREAGDFEAMRSVIRATALEWARQGREQTLSDWIEALPATVREADPWLEYWAGRAWIFVQPQRGRPALESAFERFRGADDVRGQALALNTIVTGYYYEWNNFAPLDRWLPEFERLLAEGNVERLDRGSELRARAAYLIALLFRAPERGAIDACAERLDALVDDESDVNVRMMAASTLLNYYNWKARGDRAEALVARIAPVASAPDVTPLMQVWWRTHLCFWHYQNGRYPEAAAVIGEARAIADRYGLQAYLFEIDHAEASALLTQGNYAEAKAKVDGLERRIPPARRMDWAYFHYLKANVEQRLGNSIVAVQAAERALSLALETGLPTMQVPHFIMRLAHNRMCAGDIDGGLRTLDEAIALAGDSHRKSFQQQRTLVEIALDIDAGAIDRARERLADALASYRANRQVVFLRSRPDLAAKLASFALEHGIDAEYVRLLIERNVLKPPSDAAAQWPFALRIHVLGGFELVRHGEPVKFSGKAQQRPLDLLKLLVALGGSGVDSQQLTAALWPEADGAAAKTSFDTTLFRLRKLLDVDNAIALAAGKLSLSPELCWTDVNAFQATVEATERAQTDGPQDAVALAFHAGRLFAAYRGQLLGTEDPSWAAQPRDALRARFVRALMHLGERLERAADWATASDVYRRALETDNLAEPFYRGLMRCLAATGDQAEALNAYRRCRELLSVVLGLKPSAETEALYRRIVGTPAAVPASAIRK